MIKKFAVVGLPRSGTTFLATQISQFDGIYVMPELFWFHKYNTVHFEDFIKEIITLRLSQDKMLLYNHTDIESLPFSGKSGRDLILFLEYIANMNKFRYIGINTPSNYEYLDELVSSDFQVINVERSLREIADSYSRVNWTRYGYIVPLVRYRSYKCITQVFEDRLLTIRFERFEDDYYLVEIFNFIGCDSHPVRHHEVQRKISKNAAWDDLHHKRTREKFDRSGYNTVLSNRQIELANYIERNDGIFLDIKLIRNPLLIFTYTYHLILYSFFGKWRA